jgi:predicted phage terminase large subunit-like protein
MAALAPNDFELELQDFVREVHSLGPQYEASELEKSLYEYVKAVWPLVEPLQPFVENWHIELMCRKLELIYHGKCKRAIFNVPPGTAKSLIINVFFPTWAWAKNARLRFMCASFSHSLTMRDNVKARDIVESPWYQERWAVRLAEDQNAKGRYNTEQKGWRIATSVNGVGMGEHPDFILIDDPISATQAESDTERTAANDWFDRTISQRLGRNPAIIVIMQRLHKDDLSGHLLKRGGWDHVRWPMRFEKCTCPPDAQERNRCVLHKADPDWQPDALDPRTEQGELLIPALFNETQVRQRELDLGPYGAAGQLQQRPAPEGGGLFKREWFKFVDLAPNRMRIARGYDTASTPGGGDYTATVKCGEEFEEKIVNGRMIVESTGRFYLMDPFHDQLGPDGVDKLIRATADKDGKTVPIREEKEGGSAGAAVIQARAKALVGFDYKGVPISGSKITRSKPFRAQVEAGNVYLVGNGWDEYLRELCSFPTGDHDDWVDATSCAFNAVLLEEPPEEPVSVLVGFRKR